MLSIYLKELKSLFNSLIAYLVIGVFLTGIGLYVWVFSPNIFEVEEADLSLVFQVTPYVFMFLIPAVTMRTFSEELKEGTLELLLTKPLSEWQLVIGKYLASVTLVLVALLPTLIYFYSVYQLGNPVGNIDVARAVGSYIGLILLAFAFTSIGVWTSTFTENQIVAFIISLFLALMLYEGLQYLGNLLPDGYLGFFIGEMSLANHYNSLSIGVLDTRNIIFLVSVSVLFLALTRMKLLVRKW
jgi:ABC-2 type transport system permease protein